MKMTGFFATGLHEHPMNLRLTASSAQTGYGLSNGFGETTYVGSGSSLHHRYPALHRFCGPDFGAGCPAKAQSFVLARWRSRWLPVSPVRRGGMRLSFPPLRRRPALAAVLRLTLATLALVGPLAAVTMNASDHGLLPKRGAGFVLFVSLQRQSMS